MGKVYDIINDDLKKWIACQKMFFVATAPLSSTGHINCSPKGLDSFRVINDTTVAYQDLTGSGIETISHVRENKRIVIMFCAFDGPPKIVRFHGSGKVIHKTDDEFKSLDKLFPERMGTRAYIIITVDRISDSCGYAVPFYDFKSDRDVLDKWCDAKGDQGIIDYREKKNKESIDGLQGL